MGVILVPVINVLIMALSFLYWIIFIDVAINWAISLGFTNPYNDIIIKIRSVTGEITNTVYDFIRRVIPNTIFGSMDLTPLIAFMGIYFLKSILFQIIIRL